MRDRQRIQKAGLQRSNSEIVEQDMQLGKTFPKPMH